MSSIKHEELRASIYRTWIEAKELASEQPSRELSLVVTKLEEAFHWAGDPMIIPTFEESDLPDPVSQQHAGNFVTSDSGT